MSSADIQILDTAFTSNVDGSMDIGPTADLGGFDASSNIFSPAASLFGGQGAYPAATAGTITGPSIDLLKGENWKTLFNKVDLFTITETVNSSTSYTIADPTSGLSVNFTGTGFTGKTIIVDFFLPVTVLATGTITGFSVTQNGMTLATASDYSLTASTLLAAINASVAAFSAMPLFDMWFSISTTVSGTAAVIAASLATLEPYVNIKAVDITGATPLSVDVADFKTYETVLNKVVGGFEVSDTVADIKAALIAAGSTLIADAKNISALVLSNGGATPLQLTAAQASAASALLAKLSGKAIVEIHQTSGAWTTTGHGAGLTIHDIKGVDAITGGGASEDFVFLAGWGNATISDFDKHYTGAGHDIVTLPGSEFVKGDATLLADAKPGDGGVIVTAGQDKLIFTGLTIAELNAGITAGDFKFA